MWCCWVWDPICCPQCRPHVFENLLLVLYHPVDDLSSEISVRVVWQLVHPINSTTYTTVVDLQALFNCQKQAISITLHLKIIKSKKPFLAQNGPERKCLVAIKQPHKIYSKQPTYDRLWPVTWVQLLNTNDFGTHLFKFKAAVGPEVVGHISEFTIGGEPEHVCQKTLHFGPRLLPRQTHNFNVVTPLAGWVGWSC